MGFFPALAAWPAAGGWRWDFEIAGLLLLVEEQFGIVGIVTNHANKKKKENGDFHHDVGDMAGVTAAICTRSECSTHQCFQIKDGYVEDEESDYTAFVQGTDGCFEGSIVTQIRWERGQ